MQSMREHFIVLSESLGQGPLGDISLVYIVGTGSGRGQDMSFALYETTRLS